MEEGEVVAMAEEEKGEEEDNKKSAYDLLEEARTSMEEIVARMLFIKKEGRSKTELRELVTQISLLFINLRQANRTILLEEDRVKSETDSAKAPVDFATLQLHNFLYEKNHYMKAIKACKDFKSKHPDITLVSEEEFYKSAPEEIKGNQPNGNAHDLMLRRLDFELFQRKELCKQREELEQRKRSLQDVIATRKKFLTSLPSHLKSLKKASLPVQQQLGISHTKKLKQHHLAELLPPPLYVVFSQFMAQKEAFGDNIDLEIVGSIKDAQVIARQQATKDTGGTVNTEEVRLEDDAAEDDDDVQRRRKRPKKSYSKDNLDNTGAHLPHPLHVILHILDDVGSDAKPRKLVTLKFEYVQKLNVVFVGTEGPSEACGGNILCNLFPDDTGLELPHQSAKLVTDEAAILKEKKTSCPFKWAQHLAGIDFLPEVSPMLTDSVTSSDDHPKTAGVLSGLSQYRQQHRVQTVLARIRSRMKAQLALAEHLDSLQNLKWPELKYKNIPWALHNPLCHLESWSPVGGTTDQVPSIYANEVEASKRMDLGGVAVPELLKDEVESTREDGELPSLTQLTIPLDNNRTPPSKGSGDEHSRTLNLISKSITPKRTSNGHMPWKLKVMDPHPELAFGSGSEDDEPMCDELETEMATTNPSSVKKFWKDHGAKEFLLVLSRNIPNDEKNVQLEAKVKVSMEYPLRPPLFLLNLSDNKTGCDPNASRPHPLRSESYSGWFNELKALEAEVNVHILKMLPEGHQHDILAHQVHCLAMLFDFLMDQVPLPVRKGTHVVDVGLCKPVDGMILSRYFRGRDRRRMVSWKDRGCVSGYPC
ncbi:THO complex subunit 5A [Nymphaea colorata]|nr:THO complex subunit 5A [Nymphaea colorata]